MDDDDIPQSTTRNRAQQEQEEVKRVIHTQIWTRRTTLVPTFNWSAMCPITHVWIYYCFWYQFKNVALHLHTNVFVYDFFSLNHSIKCVYDVFTHSFWTKHIWFVFVFNPGWFVGIQVELYCAILQKLNTYTKTTHTHTYLTHIRIRWTHLQN